MRRLPWLTGATLYCALAVAHPLPTGRPPEALLADRAAAELEVQDLERRALLLGEQLAARRGALRGRLRALCKFSQGGALVFLEGSKSGEEWLVRWAAARQILERDLAELRAVSDEARQLDAEQAAHSAAVAYALALGGEVARSTARPATGLARRQGALTRPVRGSLVGRFGHYRDRATQLERSRRGIELASYAGEPVRALAAGTVVWRGEVAGLGRAVVIDHGSGYLSLLARLGDAKAAVGDIVSSGAVVGQAAGERVYLELAQAGTAFDPEGWLSPP